MNNAQKIKDIILLTESAKIFETLAKRRGSVTASLGAISIGSELLNLAERLKAELEATGASLHTKEHEKIGKWPVAGCAQCQKDYQAQCNLVSRAANDDPTEAGEDANRDWRQKK